jgi:hypothetical protein
MGPPSRYSAVPLQAAGATPLFRRGTRSESGWSTGRKQRFITNFNRRLGDVHLNIKLFLSLTDPQTTLLFTHLLTIAHYLRRKPRHRQQIAAPFFRSYLALTCAPIPTAL